jgi:ATPase subunit of ABC transporter with duplicated ATPase domains
MAGVDRDYVGEISMSKGYTVGLLEQEPKLDESKTVIKVVKEAVKPIVEMIRRFDEVNAKFAEPDADFDALVAEQAGTGSGCRLRLFPGPGDRPPDRFRLIQTQGPLRQRPCACQ